MAAKKSDTENTAEVKKPEAKEPARVRIIVPYIDGEDEELTVGINGKYYKIRKGVYVDVPPEVAEVIENSNSQMVRAREFQRQYEGTGKDLSAGSVED